MEFLFSTFLCPGHPLPLPRLVIYEYDHTGIDLYTKPNTSRECVVCKIEVNT
jgi:hypothetical protein